MTVFKGTIKQKVVDGQGNVSSVELYPRTDADIVIARLDNTQDPDVGTVQDALDNIYTALEGKVINNGQLTLQVEGTTKTTFTANQSGNATFNITASDLGLSAALKFVGVSTTDPKGSSGATVSEHTIWKKGDLVLYKRTGESGYEEYVLTADSNVAANWELLGDADDYALKTTTISAGTGLTGGGSLATNRTLSLADNYGDTKNPYASKTKNYVLAAPTSAAGVPSFRALDASDIPNLNASKINAGTFDAARIPGLATSKITSGTFSDTFIASASTWNGKQDALATQTAYTSKGTSTKVPQITTNSLGQVTGITEVAIDFPAESDEKVNQTIMPSEPDCYPILTSTSETSTTTTTVNGGTYRNNNVFIDAGTGEIHAAGFFEGNTDIASKYQGIVSKLGSTTKPVYTSAAGTFAECSTYAGGTAVTLNGSSKAASTASFYAPTSQLATSTDKVYLIGATASNSLTTVKSNASVYMSGGKLYSNNAEVLTGNQTITATIKGGKKADGSTDISGSASGTTSITVELGDSGVASDFPIGDNYGVFSAVQVNPKGIVIGGTQVLAVVPAGTEPSDVGVIGTGWYFEMDAA